ncbi:MAG: DUF3313 family protein [Woeseiaceae bacterium]
MQENQRIARLLGVAATFTGLLLTGCSTVETQTFRATNNSNIDSSYVSDDANFGTYNRLLIDEMGIFFPTSAGLPEDELARIRQIFRDSFIQELDGYDYTQEPGPDMLRVSASLIDLRNAAISELPNMRSELRSAAKPGSLLFLMELKDSGNDRVLARAADSAKAPRFKSDEDNNTDWGAVEAAAQHWAALFRAFLDQNLDQ